jgi:hypothetical protein
VCAVICIRPRTQPWPMFHVMSLFAPDKGVNCRDEAELEGIRLHSLAFFETVWKRTQNICTHLHKYGAL